MYVIIFYRDRNGKEPVLEYIQELASRTDKDSRIKLQKIRDYIKYLSMEGKKPDNRMLNILTVIYGS